MLVKSVNIQLKLGEKKVQPQKELNSRTAIRASGGRHPLQTIAINDCRKRFHERECIFHTFTVQSRIRIKVGKRHTMSISLLSDRHQKAIAAMKVKICLNSNSLKTLVQLLNVQVAYCVTIISQFCKRLLDSRSKSYSLFWWLSHVPDLRTTRNRPIHSHRHNQPFMKR